MQLVAPVSIVGLAQQRVGVAVLQTPTKAKLAQTELAQLDGRVAVVRVRVRVRVRVQVGMQMCLAGA